MSRRYHYCLAVYDAANDKLAPVSSPFSVGQENGKMEFYDVQEETEDVVLLSKFGMLGEFFLGRMVNGVFEGSNSPSFKQKDTLFLIRATPDRLCTVVKTGSSKAYRYVRYYGPAGGYGNISEAGFYSSVNDTMPLAGKYWGRKTVQQATILISMCSTGIRIHRMIILSLMEDGPDLIWASESI